MSESYTTSANEERIATVGSAFDAFGTPSLFSPIQEHHQNNKSITQMKSELVRATNHLNIGKGRCNGWIEQPEEIKSGIYMWTSPSGKKYIGQSSGLKNRKSVFLNFKRRYGAPKSNYITHIDCARRKYNNKDLWSYQILVYCNDDDLNEEEIYYISLYHTTDRNIGYNMTIGGGGTRGWKMNAEQRIKHGLRQRGKVMSPEAREKLRQAKKGKKLNLTPEQLKNKKYIWKYLF